MGGAQLAERGARGVRAQGRRLLRPPDGPIDEHLVRWWPHRPSSSACETWAATPAIFCTQAAARASHSRRSRLSSPACAGSRSRRSSTRRRWQGRSASSRTRREGWPSTCSNPKPKPKPKPNPDPNPNPNPTPSPSPSPNANLRRVRREGVEEQPERAVRLQVAVLRGARVAHREQAASGQPALCEALRPLDLRRGRAEGEEGVRVRLRVEW